MNKFNATRVKRLLVKTIDSLTEIRIELSGNNRKLAGVLDQLIQEMQTIVEDHDSEEATLTFEDLVSLSKILGYIVDLVKYWFNTLSYKISRFMAALNKYVRLKCQSVKTLNYLELMLG